MFLVSIASQVNAASWDDGPGGASRDYYNRAAKLPWDKKMGDWQDAKGNSWGDVPFASESIVSQPVGATVRFNVASLINSWAKQGYDSEGFFLRGMSGNTSIKFYSSEFPDAAFRPLLVMTTSRSRYTLMPVADTYLSASTGRSLGGQEALTLSKSSPALIYFDLNDLKEDEVVLSAYLELTIQKIYNSRLLEVGVFEVTPAPISSSTGYVAVEKGLASTYLWDRGINKDSAIYYATGFEQSNWKQHWTDGGKMGQVIDRDQANQYQPLSGKALSAVLPEGERMGLNQRFKFARNGFSEPEEAYFRYYLRLGDNWDQTISSGKMPGFAGTYNTAGWGGRKPNGENGWSARGLFLKTIRQGNEKITPVGSYVYHLDQNGAFGSHWTWNKSRGALLKNNQWYCIEQYVKLNTPGESDGILKVWLDGHEVFEKTEMQFRTSSTLKIEEVWMNIYHGGMDRAVKEQTAYIDNFVVAKKYIGPIAKE